MRPYNVEIFDTSGALVCHENIGEIELNFDYLAPSSNEIQMVYHDGVEAGQYIRVVGNGEDWFGVITGITAGAQSKNMMAVGFESFINKFDTDILFDTDYQGSGISLEQVIAQYISDLYINNEDDLQNIPGLTVRTTSETIDWGLHITSDVTDMHTAIINFRDSIIIRAMEKYRIYVDVRPDFVHRLINLYVGINTAEPQVIEADLPNVIEKNVTIKQTANNLNKLTVYNGADYSQYITYYLHPNDSWDTNNADRVTPVNRDIESTFPMEGQTFEAAAALIAADRFSGRAYTNLIELTVMSNDDLIKPYAMEYGQEVRIITNGVMHTSYLTGKQLGRNTRLIFGTVRIDLTKIIRGGIANNG